MDTLQSYRQLIQNIIISHTEIPYAYGDIKFETIFDEKQDRYLLMIVGREPVHEMSTTRYVHGCLIHIDIIDGKIWIHRDGTEYGVTDELVAAGVPKDRIVLGFHSPDVRQYTGYACA